MVSKRTAWWQEARGGDLGGIVPLKKLGGGDGSAEFRLFKSEQKISSIGAAASKYAHGVPYV